MKKGLRGAVIGGVVGLISMIVVFVIWISLLKKTGDFKSYYFLFLILYFFMIFISAVINNFIISKIKRLELLIGILNGVWISLLLGFIFTIVIMIVESGICSGAHCGEIGMAAPAILILTLLILIIPNIIVGLILGKIVNKNEK
jgi:hypothetical protein